LAGVHTNNKNKAYEKLGEMEDEIGEMLLDNDMLV